jgi:hypothetical protein
VVGAEVDEAAVVAAVVGIVVGTEVVDARLPAPEQAARAKASNAMRLIASELKSGCGI